MEVICRGGKCFTKEPGDLEKWKMGRGDTFTDRIEHDLLRSSLA